MLQKCAGTLLSLCLFVVHLQAQQALEPAITELRVVADPPTPAAHTGRFELPHGELYGLLGKGFPGVDFLQSTVRLPLFNAGAAAGGTIENHRTSYFLSFDHQAFDRHRLLPDLPANASPRPLLGFSGPALISTQALGRFDHHVNERESFHLQYERAVVTSKGFPTSADVLNYAQQSGSFDNAVVLSPATVNETRAQMTEVSVPALGDAPAYRFNIYEVADNIAHQEGNQRLRGGGNFLYDRMRASFLQEGAPRSTVSQSSRNVSVYVQDQWKVNSQLVLTAGLRYDLQFLRGVRRDTNNLGPTLGFAWSPGGSKTTTLRGGYGVMYQQFSFPVLAGLISPFDAGFLPPNPSIGISHAEHAHLDFEHQFGERTTLSATYQHVRGVALGVPVQNSKGVWQLNSAASSSYDGLMVAFVQHPLSWGDYKIAYVYADGNASKGQNWDNVNADQMRRLSFTGTLHTPLRAGSGIWEQITNRVALTGYGDFTRHNELPGVDFVHLDARLSKDIQISSRLHLEMFVQKSGLLQRRSLLAKLFSGNGEVVTTSYAGFAAVGSPAGIQVGLRIRF